MFWLSQQAAPSVPMPTLSFLSSMVLTAAMPLPSSMLLPGLCATEAPWSARRCDVVVVEPHAVGGDEIRPEQAEVLQMRGRRLAVFLEADDHLGLGLLHVRVQARRRSRARVWRSSRMNSSLQWCGMVGATAGRTSSRSKLQSASTRRMAVRLAS